MILKLTIRNILKDKRTTILNLLGLSIGFGLVILISLFVHREFTYDNFHEHSEQIYIPEFRYERMDGSFEISRSLTMTDIVAMRTTLPGVENIAFLNYSYFDWDNGAWIEYDGHKYNLERMAFSDGNLNKVFSFHVKSGDVDMALDDPSSIVLTESISTKIFKDKYPVGESIKLNGQVFQVQAIMKDLPQNSSVWFSGLVNYKASQNFIGEVMDDFSYQSFFLSKINVEKESISKSIDRYLYATLPEEAVKQLKEQKFSSTLIPLKDVYFHDAVAYDPIKHGDKKLTWVILLIGVLILSLAVINYINLTLAGSLKWSKNLAIQKIFGSGAKNGVKLLVLKSTVLCLVSFIFSLVLIQLIVPIFNRLIEYPLNLHDYVKFQFFVVLFILIIFIGLVSGAIPGILISRISTAMQLRGEVSNRIFRGTIWRNLLIFQMIISIALVTGAFIVYKQIDFSLNSNLGITTENMIVLPVGKLGKEKNAFCDMVSDNPYTINHCLSSTYLNTFNQWGAQLTINGEEKDISYLIIHGNEDFIPTLNLKVQEGRNFREGANSDTDSYIINEAAKKAYGITDIEHATIKGRPIIGVVNDFNLNSYRYNIEPAAIWKTSENRTGFLTIHFEAGNRHALAAYLLFLNETWQKLGADKPFEYEFLNDRLKQMYLKEISFMNAVFSFAALAIFISCLGFLGLISFITEIKIKEIGIRKVNGAKITEILVMLNKDFVKWVAIAFAIATPIAYYAMHKWLENFAYKTELSWWVFASAGVMALGIALITVSWQSWRAARRNPVEALRYE